MEQTRSGHGGQDVEWQDEERETPGPGKSFEVISGRTCFL